MPHQAARAEIHPQAGDSRSSVVIALASRRTPVAPKPSPTFVVIRPSRPARGRRLLLTFSAATVLASALLIVAMAQRLPMLHWPTLHWPTLHWPTLDLPRVAATATTTPAIPAGPTPQAAEPAPPVAGSDPDLALAAQIPAPEDPPPPPTISSQAVVQDIVQESVLHLGKGGTLAGLLGDLNLDRQEIARALTALAPHVSLRRLPPGQEIRVTTRAPASGEEQPHLETLTIRPESRRQFVLERSDAGVYGITEKIFDAVKRLVQAAGTIRGSLMASLHAAHLPPQAMAEMLRAFSWDVSFQHDIKLGDRFAALIEQSWTEDGQRIDGGRLLWAMLTTGGGRQSYSVYRFKPQDGREFFYNRQGESVAKALLRTPLDLARVAISSGFGLRLHPLLGFTRMHTGVDFAAPPGTPVLAAGDGTIVEAGRNGGYGNWVEIRHGQGLATGYAHLLRIAPGIRPGATVHQSQVVGFVGSTGLSTGPHLHFELRRSGVPVNPLAVAQRSLRQRLKGRDLDRFRQVVERIDRLVHGEKAKTRLTGP
ncbi:MAG: M23 family metallopeptidase [Proteobacteria bacterium]|nr:M23 family metallopeptidase [Pseudomonadota bacterium]